MKSLVYTAIPVMPCLCSGLGGRPPTGARCCRRGEIISRGHNGRSGWFWRFQLHPMRQGDNYRRLGHVGWAQGTPELIGKSGHNSCSSRAIQPCAYRQAHARDSLEFPAYGDHIKTRAAHIYEPKHNSKPEAGLGSGLRGPSKTAVFARVAPLPAAGASKKKRSKISFQCLQSFM
jgi:hypothetical protein